MCGCIFQRFIGESWIIKGIENKNVSNEGVLIVPHMDWYLKTLLQGQISEKFVAEVSHRRHNKNQILKTYINKNSAASEFLVMSRVSIVNPYLILAQEWFYHEEKFYFIYECADIDFFSVLRLSTFDHIRRSNRHLIYFKHAIEAVRYLHSFELIHYDIKFENMVMDLRTKVVRLIDFESCTDWCSRKKFQGTRDYMAPEILLHEHFRDYDPGKQDVWSLGLLIMFMLSSHCIPMPENVASIHGYQKWIKKCLPNEHFLWKALNVYPHKRCDIYDLMDLYENNVMWKRFSQPSLPTTTTTPEVV